MKAGLLIVAAATGAFAAVVPRNDEPYSTGDSFVTRSFTLPPVPIPSEVPTYQPSPPAPSSYAPPAPPPSSYAPPAPPPSSYAPPKSSSAKPAPSSYKAPSSSKKPAPPSTSEYAPPKSTSKYVAPPPKPSTSQYQPPQPYPSNSIGLTMRDVKREGVASKKTKSADQPSSSVKSPPVSSAAPAPAPAPPAPAPAPAASSTAPASAAPTNVQITGVTYGGTGCPSGSVGSAISTDRTIVTLIFDEYVASIGGGAAITESRKNCQINLSLLYPGGFQYSILSADYRGYAYLDPGISGKQSSTYYFSGQTAQANTGTTWTGPYAANYYIHDTAVSASNVWSPCGQNAMLNINSQIALTSTNSTGQGLLTNDSIDLNFQQQIYIQWRACTS